MEGTKKDVEYWIIQFNNLRGTIKIDKWSFDNHVEYMDLYIKGRSFSPSAFWIFKFSKRNKLVCIFLTRAVTFPIPSKTMF